jgi:hypothetical protein
MTAHSSPSFAMRQQRDGLRSKQAFLSKPRVPGHLGAGFEAGGAAAMDCVAKRFPAIGDMPALTLKQRW